MNAPTTPQRAASSTPSTHSVLAPLTGTQLRLIDEIAYLSNLHATNAPRGGKWCQPSRRYLAEKCNRSIWTISRATCDPRFRRLVAHHQQRKLRGAWRSCKYYIVHRAAWAWAHALHTAISTAHRPHTTHLS